MKRKQILAGWAMFWGVAILATAGERIPPTHPDLHFKGVLSRRVAGDGGLELSRFPFEMYDTVFRRRRQAAPGKPVQPKARTTTGVELVFKTDSDHVTLFFKTPVGFEHRGANWRVRQNGRTWKDFDFPARQREMTIELVSATPGKPVVYTVVFPSWSNPFFYGLTLDPGKKLLPYTPPHKPLYVAYGDSVSHGTGQKSATYLTWPYQLAQKLDYDFHSLAVGGASVKLDVVKVFQQFDQIALITFYLGINDSGNKTPAQYKKACADALALIRKHHPESKIFCITLHTLPADKKGRYAPLAAYRQPLADVVTARRAAGDTNIFLVKGTELVGLDDAASPGNVHLSVAGARHWAEAIYPLIVRELKR
jgi:lysophospholipase L1-like esterase